MDSGAERATQRWSEPLRRFDLPRAVHDFESLHALRKHWLVMRGPFYTWPFRDPFDYTSTDDTFEDYDSAGAFALTDQTIGTGDGFERKFQLIKTYETGCVDEIPFVRTIRLIEQADIGIDGIESPIPWTVDTYTGVIEFETAPAIGEVISAGYVYSVEVRYEHDDSLSQTAASFSTQEIGSLGLVEVRACCPAMESSISGGESS